MRMTATEALRREVEIIPPKSDMSQEDYHRWCLAEIERAARHIAQVHIDALIKIEQRKPPKPIFIPIDQLADDLIKQA